MRVQSPVQSPPSPLQLHCASSRRHHTQAATSSSSGSGSTKTTPVGAAVVRSVTPPMTPQPLEHITSAGPSPGGLPHFQLKQQQQQQQLAERQQQQLAIMSALQPAPEAGPRPGYIPLTMLIEFIIQRTYHDLTVLAELLPRKTDMERKIEIYNFTARTKQLFIRLLALVKWASSSATVEKSCDIQTFLDKQSMLFVDTADALSRMSREMLVNARLPNFQIPEAIEVLTTGTYSRLPTCIKDRIVPIEPLVGAERKKTLLRLNQIIEHRLVTGRTLPQQMRNFHIENGRVQFRVDQEFEVGLTLMGDEPEIAWRMLEIEILVEDNETGSANTALVAGMQLNFIHELVQTRLAECPDPIQEVYNCLHFFCQSLQLEVLFGQIMHLKQHRLNDSVHVDEYVRGSKLTVSYWRELSTRAEQQRPDNGYRLSVQTDPNDSARPLAVIHRPSIGNQECAEMANRAVHMDGLSMERLLVHTVYIRSLARLCDIRAEFQTFLPGMAYKVRGTPAILTVPILLPCHEAEHLHVTVDTHTGQLRCHVPNHTNCSIAVDIQTSMNGDHARLPALVIELRYWLARRRCERSLQSMPIVTYERLPLMLPQLDASAAPAAIDAEHVAVLTSGRNKLFVRYNKHPDVIVVIEISECAERVGEMEYAFYLAHVVAVDGSSAAAATADAAATETSPTPTPGVSKTLKIMARIVSSARAIANNDQQVASESAVEHEMTLSPQPDMSNAITSSTATSSVPPSLPKTYLRVQQITAFDTFAITHGPSAPLFDEPPTKRFRSATTTSNPPPHSTSAYLVPSVSHAIAMFADKLPFVSLAMELDARAIPNSGIQADVDASVVCLKILALPRPNASTSTLSSQMACIDTEQWAALQRRLLAVNVRHQLNRNMQTRNWRVELVFADRPVRCSDSAGGIVSPKRDSITFEYPMDATDRIAGTVDVLLADWSAIVHLHGLVYDFGKHLAAAEAVYRDRGIPMCTVLEYTYTKLLLGYGPQHECLMTVSWCSDECRFRLCFGRVNADSGNAHRIIASELEAQLNRHFSLVQIVHLLHETWQPLSAVGQLDVIPHYGIPRPSLPVLSFCLLPQTPTLLRIAYQALYCVELRVHGNGFVSLRDGAAVRNVKNGGVAVQTAVDDFTATQGLISFLRQYAADPSSATASPYLRRMQGEDDHRTLSSSGSGSPSQADQTNMDTTVTPAPLPPLSINLSFANGALGGNTTAAVATAITKLSHGGPQSPQSAAAGLRFPTSVTPPPTPASPLSAVNHTNAATSPVSHHYNSSSSTPANGVPSPLTLTTHQRPGSAPPPTTTSAAHSDPNSPFNAQSPAAASAASRALPRPPSSVGAAPTSAGNNGGVPGMASSKGTNNNNTTNSVTAGRSWNAAVPTLLTYHALEELLRPCEHPEADVNGPNMCPLERFLGSVNMRRNLLRYIQSEDFLTPVECATPGVVVFRVDTLQFRVTLNKTHMQSLHMKVRQICVVPRNNASPTTTSAASTTTTAPKTADPKAKTPPPLIQFTDLDLRTLERFFEQRVASPPYRPNTLFGFCRMLNVPALVLRDLLRIIRVEMEPERAAEENPELRWHVQLLMRVPPSAPVIVPTGNAAVHMIRQKILFFLQITLKPDECIDAPMTSPSSSPPSTPHNAGAQDPNDNGVAPSSYVERPSLVIPMVYDVNANITQLAERRDATGTITSSATNSASQLLRRYAEHHKANAASSGECSIFPAIRELLMKYVMPTSETVPNSSGSNATADQQQQVQQQPLPTQQSQQQVHIQTTATTKTHNHAATPTMESTVATKQQQQQQQQSQSVPQPLVPSPSIVIIGGGPSIKTTVSAAPPPSSSLSSQQQKTAAFTVTN